MTKEISTDAELISRLLTTRPTPAECLVAAARIEQLANATRATPAATDPKVTALVNAAEWALNHISSLPMDEASQAEFVRHRAALDALREGRPA